MAIKQGVRESTTTIYDDNKYWRVSNCSGVTDGSILIAITLPSFGLDLDFGSGTCAGADSDVDGLGDGVGATPACAPIAETEPVETRTISPAAFASSAIMFPPIAIALIEPPDLISWQLIDISANKIKDHRSNGESILFGGSVFVRLLNTQQNQLKLIRAQKSSQNEMGRNEFKRHAIVVVVVFIFNPSSF